MSAERNPIYTSRLVFRAVARSARACPETLRVRSPTGYVLRTLLHSFTHRFSAILLHPQFHRNRPQIALFAADPLGETTRTFLRAGVFRLWFSPINRAVLRVLEFSAFLPLFL